MAETVNMQTEEAPAAVQQDKEMTEAATKQVLAAILSDYGKATGKKPYRVRYSETGEVFIDAR